jgi:Zn-dependent metalloprotease
VGSPSRLARVAVLTAAATVAGTLTAMAGTPASAASPRSAAVDRARDQVAAHADTLGWAKGQALTVKDVVLDADGAAHVRFERTFDGLPVVGGDLVVHQGSQGGYRGADRASDARISVPSTDASVSAQRAAAVAAAAVDFRVTSSAPELSVYALRGAPRLVWQTAVDGLGAQDQPVGRSVSVDARTGAVVDSWDTVVEATGTGNSLYVGSVSIETTLSGGSYQLIDSTRGGGRTEDGNNGSTSSTSGVLFTDPDNTWGTGTTASRQSAAVDAHYGVAATWDYYKNTFGRTGIKNDGKAARAIVHVGTGWVNASWSDACFCMRYGDGDGRSYGPLVSLDVAGHEMSHGVTSATAGLTYRRESGGLNESTSDIFGTMVEWTANAPGDPGDYLIGERFAMGSGTPLRYMDKPSRDGASADCWSKQVGSLNVHYSSGVGNHLFYLLAEGSGAKTIGTVNYNSPTCNGSTVTGIGRTAAAAIWYRALTTYMTSSTGYAGARVATLKAATDLYGGTSTEYAGVAAAWTAVNVK